MARAAARYPPESETEDGEEARGRYGSDRGPRPKNKRSGSVGAEPPVVCLLRVSVDSASGALMGSIIGLGSDLMKKKGFKGSLADVGSSSKTFAVLAGVHSIVACLPKRFRGNDDAINAGIAGCCTGLAFSVPGSPGVLLQSCLCFGTFSFLIQGLNKNQDAITLPRMASGGNPGNPADVLPPFMLPLPHQFLEGFFTLLQILTEVQENS